MLRGIDFVHFVNSVRLSWFHDERSLFHRRSPSGFAVHLTRPTRSIHGFQMKSQEICRICVIRGRFFWQALNARWRIRVVKRLLRKKP
jgi:hypothetical protein